MTTYTELTERIHALLCSSTGLQEQMTWLTSSATNSATSLAVSDSAGISRGISEVDNELVYVASTGVGTLTLAPFGRGFRGSTAATHAINAPVTFNPAFPRVEIRRAINECLNEIYPALWQTKSTTFTFSGSQITYQLPADCDQVVKVLWEVVGATNYWETAYGWRFEPNAEEVSTRSLTLVDLPRQGATVKVVYQAKFTELVNDSDLLTGTGLPASAEDVVLYCVAAKLIRFMDVSRLQLDNVENLSRAAVVQAGDAGKVANQLYAMYQQRVAEERSRLLTLNPPSLYFTR